MRKNSLLPNFYAFILKLSHNLSRFKNLHQHCIFSIKANVMGLLERCLESKAMLKLQMVLESIENNNKKRTKLTQSSNFLLHDYYYYENFIA
ncbi:CLUMA_CG006005, isoform A [Clunio marinus]|uniref:CLUMA_CG006005, isoform A n=1 Tax=Clunio marinus TaxID=568069 RepID=A0A1J1I0S7_9DIPT|nr:CLUMA_CG006005, isoform A [Clunio marinus]